MRLDQPKTPPLPSADGDDSARQPSTDDDASPPPPPRTDSCRRPSPLTTPRSEYQILCISEYLLLLAVKKISCWLPRCLEIDNQHNTLCRLSQNWARTMARH